MKHLSFIVGPLEERSNQVTRSRNYGVERLIGALIAMGVEPRDIGACDFSFDVLDSEVTLERMLAAIQPSNVYGFSSYSFNHAGNILLASALRQRQPDATIIFGGPAASELSTEIPSAFPHIVDYTVVGLGEEPLIRLLSGQRPSEIPGLIWTDRRPDRVTVIKNEGRTRFFERVMPYHAQWTTLGHEFLETHFRVLASIGCAQRCDFCSIVEKEPVFVRRSLDLVVEEIAQDRAFAGRPIDVQILDQNYVRHLPALLAALKERALLAEVRHLSVISRADALTAGRNPAILEEAIAAHPETYFTLFIGIESFSDKVLAELGKGTTAAQNMAATRLVSRLAGAHRNFRYAISMIGITPGTTRDDILTNIRALNACYDDADEEAMLPPLTTSLQYRPGLARRLGIPREPGLYTTPSAVPEDEATVEALRRYQEAAKMLPPKHEREWVASVARIIGCDIFAYTLRDPKAEQFKMVYRTIDLNLLYAAMLHDEKPHLLSRAMHHVAPIAAIHDALMHNTRMFATAAGISPEPNLYY